MKKLFFVCLIFIAGNVFAQDKAKIYFMRNNLKSIATGMTAFIFMDKEKMCALKNFEYGVFEASPGEHGFSIMYNKSDMTSTYKLNVEAGRNYYFNFVMSGKGPIFDFIELTEKSGERYIIPLSEIDCAKSIEEK